MGKKQSAKGKKPRHGNAPLRASSGSEAAGGRRERDRRRRLIRIVIVLVVLAMLALTRVFAPACQEGFVLGGPPPLPAEERVEITLDRIEVLDGDTIRLDGRTIRFLGCDTPESENPFFEGDQEPWASRATAFVERALREAETIEVEVLAQRDRYNRLLGHLFVEGESLSLMLVQEGLAIETVSHFGDNGFPELAGRIQDAADEVGELPFQPPHEWRQENRIRR